MYSPHYDKLDEVLGTRAVITMPSTLHAGTPASECWTPGPQLDDGPHVSESEEEDMPLAAVARKRTAANSTAADEATKKKRTRKTRKRVSEEDEGVSPLQQRLLEMQERQMEVFAAAERRTEDLLRLETEQRKAEEEARARDHEFLLKVAELFSKK